MILISRLVLPAAMAAACVTLAGSALAQDRQPNRCAEEAAAIRRAETQLPRLDVAPPNDQQIVCITLETNMLFAQRLAAHVAQCPRSPHVRSADSWQRTGSLYTGLFSDRRCKPAIRSYRG